MTSGLSSPHSNTANTANSQNGATQTSTGNPGVRSGGRIVSLLRSTVAALRDTAQLVTTVFHYGRAAAQAIPTVVAETGTMVADDARRGQKSVARQFNGWVARQAVHNYGTIKNNLQTQEQALHSLIGTSSFKLIGVISVDEFIDKVAQFVLDEITGSETEDTENGSWWQTLCLTKVSSDNTTHAPSETTSNDTENFTDEEELLKQIVRCLTKMALGNIVLQTPCRADNKRYLSDVLQLISAALKKGVEEQRKRGIRPGLQNNEKRDISRYALAPLLGLAFPTFGANLQAAEKEVLRAAEGKGKKTIEAAQREFDKVIKDLSGVEKDCKSVAKNFAIFIAWNNVISRLPFEKMFGFFFDAGEEARYKELNASLGGKCLLDLASLGIKTSFKVLENQLAEANQQDGPIDRVQAVASVGQHALQQHSVAAESRCKEDYTNSEDHLSFFQGRIHSLLSVIFLNFAKKGADKEKEQDHLVAFLNHVRSLFVEQITKKNEDAPILNRIADALITQSGLIEERAFEFLKDRLVSQLVNCLEIVMRLDPYLNEWMDVSPKNGEAEQKYQQAAPQQSVPHRNLQTSLADWILQMTVDNVISHMGFPDLFENAEFLPSLSARTLLSERMVRILPHVESLNLQDLRQEINAMVESVEKQDQWSLRLSQQEIIANRQSLYNLLDRQANVWHRFKTSPQTYKRTHFSAHRTDRLTFPSSSAASAVAQGIGVSLFQQLWQLETLPPPEVVQELPLSQQQELRSWIANQVIEKKSLEELTTLLANGSKQNPPPGRKPDWENKQGEFKQWLSSTIGVWQQHASLIIPWIEQACFRIILGRQAFISKIREESQTLATQFCDALTATMEESSRMSDPVKQGLHMWLEGRIQRWMTSCTYGEMSSSQSVIAALKTEWKKCSQSDSEADRKENKAKEEELDKLFISFEGELDKAVEKLPAQDPAWQFMYKQLHTIIADCLRDIDNKIPQCVQIVQEFMREPANGAQEAIEGMGDKSKADEIDARLRVPTTSVEKAERALQEATTLFMPLVDRLLPVLGIEAHPKLNALGIKGLLRQQFARLLVMGYDAGKKLDASAENPLHQLCITLFQGVPLAKQAENTSAFGHGLEAVGAHTLTTWIKQYLETKSDELAKILNESLHLQLPSEALTEFGERITYFGSSLNQEAMQSLLEHVLSKILPQILMNINGHLQGNLANTPQDFFKHVIDLIHKKGWMDKEVVTAVNDAKKHDNIKKFPIAFNDASSKPNNRLERQAQLRSLFVPRIHDLLNMIAGTHKTVTAPNAALNAANGNTQIKEVMNTVEDKGHPLYAFPLSTPLKQSIWKELLPNMLSDLLIDGYKDIQEKYIESAPLVEEHQQALQQHINQVSSMVGKMVVQLLPGLSETWGKPVVETLRDTLRDPKTAAQKEFKVFLEVNAESIQKWLNENFKGMTSDKTEKMEVLSEFIEIYVEFLMKTGLTNVALYFNKIDKEDPEFLTKTLTKICQLAEAHRAKIAETTKDVFCKTHPFEVPPEEMLGVFKTAGLQHPSLDIVSGEDLQKKKQAYFVELSEKVLTLAKLNADTVPLPALIRDTLFKMLQNVILPNTLETIYHNLMSPEVFNTLQVNIVSQLDAICKALKEAQDNPQIQKQLNQTEQELLTASGTLLINATSLLPTSIAKYVLHSKLLHDMSVGAVGDAVVSTIQSMLPPEKQIPGAIFKKEDLGLTGLLKKILKISQTAMHPGTFNRDQFIPGRPIEVVDGEYKLEDAKGEYTFNLNSISDQPERIRRLNLIQLQQEQMQDKALNKSRALGVEGLDLGTRKVIEKARKTVDTAIEKTINCVVGNHLSELTKRTLVDVVLEIVHLFATIIAIPFMLLYGIVVLPLMYFHVGRQVQNLQKNLTIPIHEHLVLKSVDEIVDRISDAAGVQQKKAAAKRPLDNAPSPKIVPASNEQLVLV